VHRCRGGCAWHYVGWPRQSVAWCRPSAANADPSAELNVCEAIVSASDHETDLKNTQNPHPHQIIDNIRPEFIEELRALAQAVFVCEKNMLPAAASRPSPSRDTLLDIHWPVEKVITCTAWVWGNACNAVLVVPRVPIAILHRITN